MSPTLRSGSSSQRLESPQATLEWGRILAKSLTPNTIIALSGELGAGKTHLVKGIALGLGLPIEDEVQSPTFVILSIYETAPPLFHFDLYRLKTAEEFQALGFEEFFTRGGICAIEWPERITSLLPLNTLRISLAHAGSGCRIATISLD